MCEGNSIHFRHTNGCSWESVKIFETENISTWEGLEPPTFGFMPNALTSIRVRHLLSHVAEYWPNKSWDEITYPFPNFNGCTVDVWEWIRNFVPHHIMDVISYPWCAIYVTSSSMVKSCVYCGGNHIHQSEILVYRMGKSENIRFKVGQKSKYGCKNVFLDILLSAQIAFVPNCQFTIYWSRLGVSVIHTFMNSSAHIGHSPNIWHK